MKKALIIIGAGMIIIDTRGVVVGKLFLEAYSSRVDSAAALAFAIEALGLDETTPHPNSASLQR